MLIARFAQFQVQLGAYSALLHIPLYVYVLNRGGGDFPSNMKIVVTAVYIFNDTFVKV